MKIRDILLEQVSRIDTECDSTQEYLDRAKESIFTRMMLGEELDRAQQEVWKKRAVGSMLEMLASLLPKD